MNENKETPQQFLQRMKYLEREAKEEVERMSPEERTKHLSAAQTLAEKARLQTIASFAADIRAGRMDLPEGETLVGFIQRYGEPYPTQPPVVETKNPLSPDQLEQKLDEFEYWVSLVSSRIDGLKTSSPSDIADRLDGTLESLSVLEGFPVQFERVP